MLKTWLSHTLRSTRTQIRGAFFAVGLVAVTLGTVATPLSTAHAQTPTGYGQNTSSCEIETVGWIICPVMRSIAKLADYGFAFINQNFLKIEFGIFNSDSGVYKAWELMLSVANALFVLALMWIIYSQLTGKNSGGYTIKRMLPKLIIAAILVNVSYFICTIAIELSNIIGGSVLAIMQEVSDRIGPAAMTLSSAENGFDDSRLSDITSEILKKQGTVWILLAPVAAVTVSIAVICAAGLVLLIMRKVVVAMLVLISPLMFVTYLLPNTEKYFQQWARLFFQLLLLYPVIAFLLGTGQIISATIINVGSGGDSNYRVRDDNYNARNGGSGSATTDLAAAGAAVLPLLGTWFLLKSLSSVVTNTGSRVADSIGRRGKNQEKKIKAQMENKAKQSVAGSGLPTYERRPAFTRRRRNSVADNLATNSSKPKEAGRAANGSRSPSLLDRAMGAGGEGENPAEQRTPQPLTQQQEAQAQLNAQLAAQDATQGQVAELKGAIATAENQSKPEDKKKTAKDIFNNLNKTRQMGGGGNNGGGGGGTASAGGGAPAPQTVAAPSAPINNYPAATRNSSGGAPAPSAPSSPQQIVAIPVQVDASSFLSNNTSPSTPAGMGMPSLSSNEVQSKATERANKYLFDAQNELNDASHKLDEIKEARIAQQKIDEANKSKENKDTR